MKRRWAALAVAGLAVAGCLDIEPVPYAPRVVDAGPVDAGAAEGGARARCRECVTSPEGACHGAYQACEANQRCVDATECALDAGCLNLGELAARIACAVPCLESAGISGNADPALALALDVNSCANDRCGGSCASLSQ